MNRFTLTTTTLITLFCVFPLPLFSEALEEVLFLDIPVVVTPTLTETSADKAPASITVITEKEIRESGASTLADILSRTTGIYIDYSSDGRNLTVIRGIHTEANDKYKLLINGHSYFEPVWNTYDSYEVNIDTIRQIEIVRGPESALYGTGAFAGTINIITRQPRDNYGLNIAVTAGMPQFSQETLSYGKVQGSHTLGITASARTEKAPELTQERDALFGMPFALSPGNVKGDNEKREITATITEGNLELNLLLSSKWRVLPMSETVNMTQQGETNYFDYGYGEAKYSLPLGPSSKLRFRASYDAIRYMNRGQIWPDNFTLGGDINGDGIAETWPDGIHAEYGYRSAQCSGETMLEHHINENDTLLIGIFYEYTKLSDPFIKSEFHPSYFTNPGAMTDFSNTPFNWIATGERTVSGIFFQNELNITRNWYAILGGRYDSYSDVGDTFNPRCGLVWRYLREGGFAKLLYGTAFRAPSFGELYMNPTGNRKLKPETLESLELDIDHVFAGKLQTTLAAYAMRTKDLTMRATEIDPTTSVPYTNWINHNKTEHWGCELTGKLNFTGGHSLNAGYAYTHATDAENGNMLPFIPEEQATLGGTVRLHQKLIWNLSVVHTGSIHRETGDTRPSLPSRVVINTALRLERIRNFDFFVAASNLMDEKRYSPMPIAAGAGMSDFPHQALTYSCGTTYRF